LEGRLIYRFYCDTLLVEVEGDPQWQLLPRLLLTALPSIEYSSILTIQAAELPRL
jgi:hypothetical protein